MKDYESTTQRIRVLLLKYPHMRDNVNALVANIWGEDLRDKKLNPNDILLWISRGQLTSYKTIDRIWRRAQKNSPEMRGESWKKRQGELQDKAKKALGYNL